MSPKQFDGVDAILASPPCQSYSAANVNGAETEGDRTAALAVCGFISTLRPRFVVIENVGAYRHSSAFKSIADTLTDCGYGAEWQVRDAADYGVPQNRRRLFLRAVRGGHVPPWQRTHSKAGTGGLKRWNGWYAAVQDLLPTCPESAFANWQLTRLQSSDFAKTFLHMTANTNIANPTGTGVLPRGCPSNMVNTGCHGVRAFLVGQQSGAVLGDNSRAVQVTHVDDPSPTVRAGFTGGGPVRALLVEGDAAGDRCPTVRDIEEPSFTMKTASGGRVHRAWLDQGRVVAMTPRCLARFMTLPDSYELPTKVSLACKIIGNGVACDMMTAVCKSLDTAVCDVGVTTARQAEWDF